MRILVLMGGESRERDISLASGRAVAAALQARGHQVQAVDVTAFRDLPALPQLRSCDVVFPALHGGAGEDGRLQALLDLLGVPYALSGQLASALAMNKAAAKRLMRGAGIPTPDWLHVTWDTAAGRPRAVAAAREPRGGERAALSLAHLRERAEAELGFPLVIKPNADGSSVGVEIVRDARGFDEAFARAAAVGADLLLERYVPGRELTVAILLGRRLPLVEIRPREGFYDYANKYTAGATEYLVPAPVHSPLYEQISGDALRLYDLLGCAGMARVDVRLDGDAYFCLEANTIPGLTETSLVPKAAAAVGIEFGELVEDLCLAGLEARAGSASAAAAGPGAAPAGGAGGPREAGPAPGRGGRGARSRR